jgi:NADH-quinone oxidoreductase subunit E
VRPTRGPRLCTFTEVSRVLAGFPDDLADEGPSAGPATLLGLELFREQEAAQEASSRRIGPEAKKTTKRAATRKRAPAETSAHDAPMKTAASDTAHDATPGNEEPPE